jgi:hypothetical protein
VLVLVLVPVAFVAGHALGSHHETTRTRSAPTQLASVETGCDAWAATTAHDDASDWCPGMTGWMHDRAGAEMMGSRLWSGPDQLRASCRQWVKGSPDQSGDNTASTCDDMVAWMDRHSTGRWGGWTMHDR